MNQIAIHIDTVHGYEHFEIRCGKLKAELWTLPGLEDEAIVDAVIELESFHDRHP